MSKNQKRIVIALVIVILYLVPILVLYTAYNRKPEVIMVSRSYRISTAAVEQSTSL